VNAEPFKITPLIKEVGNTLDITIALKVSVIGNDGPGLEGFNPNGRGKGEGCGVV